MKLKPGSSFYRPCECSRPGKRGPTHAWDRDCLCNLHKKVYASWLYFLVALLDHEYKHLQHEPTLQTPPAGPCLTCLVRRSRSSNSLKSYNAHAFFQPYLLAANTRPRILPRALQWPRAYPVPWHIQPWEHGLPSLL